MPFRRSVDSIAMVLRAAFHIHSTWSYDGSWTLPQIASAFAARSYNLLLVSEHDRGFSEERLRDHRRACKAVSNDRILLIPGIEYSDPTNTVHILVWGDVPFLGEGRQTLDVLQQAGEHGGVCVFAHPARKAAWQAFRKEWLGYLAGIEVWNRKTDGWSPGREAGQLVLETGASPLVGIDFHTAKQFFPLAVLMNVEGSVDERKVLDALRLGKFHCEAFGVDFDIFTRGLAGSLIKLLESFRRLAARILRFRPFRSRSSQSPS